MARPKKNVIKKSYSVMLEPDIVKKIDILAKKAGLTRSNFMRNLLITGLDDAKLFDRFGLISLFAGGRDTINKFKKKILLDDLKLLSDE